MVGSRGSEGRGLGVVMVLGLVGALGVVGGRV